MLTPTASQFLISMNYETRPQLGEGRPALSQDSSKGEELVLRKGLVETIL